VTEKRLEIAELVRRIHIGQHSFAAKHRDVCPVDHVHPQVFEQFQHLQAPLDETSYDCRMAAASVDRAQWMISAFGPRHDSIHRVAQRDQAFEESGRDEGHVTGNEDQTVVASGGQRRIETAQRTAVRDPIGDMMNSGGVFVRTRTNQQDIVGQLTELIELTLENSSPADTQRAFIAAAEAARLTAGENRGACHRLAILPPA
jgi:hypothetical protein